MRTSMLRVISRRLIQAGYVLIFISLGACTDAGLNWEKAVKSGKLRFVTIENPVTYYPTSSGPHGFEYELALRFSDYTDLDLELLVASMPVEAISMVRNNKALVAGAALPEINGIKNLKSGPAYDSTTHQLVYRQGDPPPAGINDITGSILNITELQYQALNRTLSGISEKVIIEETDMASVFKKLQQGELHNTVADKKMIHAFRYLYPDIRVAFDLASELPVTWVYNSNDRELDRHVYDFFNEISSNGVLERLKEKYFNHLVLFDYIDSVTFLQRIRDKLPEFKGYFEKTGREYNLDWTLLAAMSYQESHWSPGARSPTGVRGLMMLTQDTASYIGIEDRLNPEQSIEGGARYFREVLKLIPGRISEPDRTWFALAAYNIGYRHLENARVIAQSEGGNPDLWKDVRKTLVRISSDDNYKHLQSGQIRWYEPVVYVGNIRRYQDILRWFYRERSGTTGLTTPGSIPEMNLRAL